MTSPNPSLSHERLLPEVTLVLAAWKVTPSNPPVAVAGGTLNWNFDVRAGGDRYFLRCYRTNLETPRIAGEHELLLWSAQRGIPAPVPIPTAQGETVAHHNAQRWALFPWMPGASVTRGTLTARQATSLGDMHGRIQATLATHPASAGAALSMRWDKAQSLAILGTLIESAKQKGIEPWIVEGIEHQRRILDQFEVLPPAAFAELPCQLLHGDFHDQQALFQDETVTAIVDWEIWHTDPRAWELVRSLAFSNLLDSPLCGDYLRGYRQHIQLAEAEARLALQLWFQSRIVGLWAWWAYVMDGNERVATFFPGIIAELDQLTDSAWTESITRQFIAAVCG